MDSKDNQRLQNSNRKQCKLRPVPTRDKGQDWASRAGEKDGEAGLAPDIRRSPGDGIQIQASLREGGRASASKGGTKVTLVIGNEDFMDWTQYDYKNGKLIRREE